MNKRSSRILKRKVIQIITLPSDISVVVKKKRKYKKLKCF